MPQFVLEFHVVFIDEQVLWLEISMDKSVLMQEVDSGNSLDEEIEGCFLRETTLFLDEHKQIALSHILHY